ncbi:MAG: hypothetical protein V7733_08115 [Paraglaciecola polaris]|uniref:hypothetical protein n=1 Tax=Paraglaciecola polaris TaxID=222814 RepID=UPI0030022CBF
MPEDIVKGLKEYLVEKIKSDENFAKEFVALMAGLASLPENIRIFSEEAAMIGWFSTSESFLGEMKKAFDQGQAALDQYMINEIDSNYVKIKSSILSLHSNRKEILTCAFELHERMNWIASIPLFLSQTEGVFSENVGSFLFSEHTQRKEKLAEKFRERAEQYMPYLYSPFEVETQFSSSISSKSQAKKRNGPNRNGILHGSRKHLDYGSKINSYKCISLLSYVSMVFASLEVNKI